MPLGRAIQQDFAAGMVRSVAPHLIPENGVYDALNCVTSDDGSLPMRGGSAHLAAPAFGTGGLRFLWEGWLQAGKRTVVADNNDFGVLDAAETGWVNIGGNGMAKPVPAVALDGVLFLPGGLAYGGSRKTAAYSTGTVTATNGSKVVTGAGTTWNTLVDAGMFLVLDGRKYVVASIDSTTQLTLRDAYQGVTGAGKTYQLAPTVTPPYSSAGYAVVAHRLISWSGNVLRFSHRHDWNTVDETDNHEFPGGVQILWVTGVRDAALVFTTAGVWVISNMAYNLTDAGGNPQQRVEQANPELILWDPAGIAAWENGIVVPAIDGLWVVDALSTPTRLSDSIDPFLHELIQDSRQLGQATTYRDHYLVPILSSSRVEELLVCRLNRPTQFRSGVAFPWTRLGGYGAECSALTRRVSTTGDEFALIGAHRASGRLLELRYFDPDEAGSADADGSDPIWMPILRDIPTGSLNLNMVRRVRARYELEGPVGEDPIIQAAYSEGERVENVTEWGLFDWGAADWSSPDTAEWKPLDGDAPEDDGRSPFTWPINKRQRFMRLRLQSSGAVAKLALRSVELFIRPSGKDR